MKYISTFVKVFLIIFYTFVSIIGVFFVMLFNKSGFQNYARHWGKAILMFAGIKLEIIGNIDKKDNYVFAVNHTSYFDIPILLTALNIDFRIIYKKQLEKIPFFGWILAQSPYIAIDRENPRNAVKSLNLAVENIKAGASVIIFPEGTRQQSGEIGEFKKGAFRIAEKSGKSIVPVSISGCTKIVEEKNVIKATKVLVHISEPIPIPNKNDELSDINIFESIREIIINNKKY